MSNVVVRNQFEQRIEPRKLDESAEPTYKGRFRNSMNDQLLIDKKPGDFFRNSDEPRTLEEDQRRMEASACIPRSTEIGEDKDASNNLAMLRESALVISTHLTECQSYGNMLLFEMLTLISELIADFLEIYERKNLPSIGKELYDIANNFIQEAGDLENLNLTQCEKSAPEFLLQKGIQYAKEGEDAERADMIGYSMLKYTRALGMFFPMAFSPKEGQKIPEVHQLYLSIYNHIQKLSKKEQTSEN